MTSNSDLQLESWPNDYYCEYVEKIKYFFNFEVIYDKIDVISWGLDENSESNVRSGVAEYLYISDNDWRRGIKYIDVDIYIPDIRSLVAYIRDYVPDEITMRIKNSN